MKPFLAAILMASSAFAQTGYVSLDGLLWAKSEVADRTFWLVGYDDGFTNALKLAASMKSETDKERPAPKTSSERIHLRNIQRYAVEIPQILSNRAILDEMTLFYKDFRNTPACWADAEPVAELALTVGAPSEADLDSLRSEDAKSGCGKFPVK
jgi:hypothetical protein